MPFKKRDLTPKQHVNNSDSMNTVIHLAFYKAVGIQMLYFIKNRLNKKKEIVSPTTIN
jgi:hypothetical protein